MGAGIDGIVTGGDHMVVFGGVAVQVGADVAGDLRPACHRQRAAFAEVVLHIDDDESAHGPTVSRLSPGIQARASTPGPVTRCPARTASGSPGRRGTVAAPAAAVRRVRACAVCGPPGPVRGPRSRRRPPAGAAAAGRAAPALAGPPP